MINPATKQSRFFVQLLDCFAEPVIGRAFARPVGADPLARNDDGGYDPCLNLASTFNPP